jgi:Peptidase family C25/FlgD Ig-like domain
MKKILLPFLLFISIIVQSQAYNNEWIDYNKTYYKFKVGATGLYRINKDTLLALGIGNTPAEQFQLWRNGEQVPLYTTAQTGVMGAGGYIEFWGERNDGKPDKALYRVADFQLNDKHSLETDTASFFLTINPVIANNLRFTPVSNNLPTALPVEPFFMHTTGIYYKAFINLGFASVVGSSIYSSAYDQGEGWTSGNIGTGGNMVETFSNLLPYTGIGAPVASLKMNITGNAQNERRVELQVNNNQVALQTLDFFDYTRIDVPVAAAEINSGTAAVKVINRCTVPSDRIVVAQTELIYPRLFNFGGANNFMFELPANTAGNYLEIAGFNYGDVSPVLYDFTNGKRYVCDISTSPLVKVVLQPSATPRKLILVTQDPSFPKNVTVASVQQRNFINYALPANQGNYLIISHPALTVSSSSINQIEAYKAYRSSATGGSHNAKIYMIDQLIDQFGFGIKNNPEAVRSFTRWARNTFSQQVKNVLLIGKGVRYDAFRANESSPDMEKLHFIPTFGVPATDILMVANPGLDGIPQVSIGRISAINGDEVATYLSKVMQYEQQQAFSSPLISEKAWMKNVVQVVGASDAGLQRTLDINMANYKNTITDTLYGANVHSFSKSSVDPVEQSNSTRLKNLFQEGIGIVTYFGHSSATTLEYNLDNPQNYNNAGKYPLFILLGCNAGNFFTYNLGRLQSKETISEKYILAQDRGGIASIASTSLGIVHYLDIHNTETYKAITKTMYGKTIGEIMHESIVQSYNITTQNDFYMRLQIEQTTLHGDPAIKLNSAPKADYAIEAPLVKVSPSFISVGDQSFKLDASFVNLGKAVNKTIVVEIKRTYPDLTTQVIRRDTIPGTRFSDSLTYDIPIVATRDKGLNRITVTVDADNEVDELYETNNSVTKDFFIYEDEARPILPYNYAIVNQQNIKLYASTANPFSATKQYNMEIDTTELFNSPFKVTRTVNSTGGVMEFTPGITFTDSTVYYWRVAPVLGSLPPIWNSASFIYLPNSDAGFNQSHYFQHTKSDKQRILLNQQDRQWKFDSSSHFIFAKNGVFLTATAQEGDLIVSPDGDPYIRSACVGFSLIFNVFDPRTFKPEKNLTGRYGSALVCQPSRQWNYEFSYMTPAARKLAMNYMDSIPNGAFVVVRSINNFTQTTGFINDWIADESINGAGKTLYHKLKSVGFNDIDQFTSAKSFIHIYQKGNSGFIPASGISQGIYDLVVMTKDLKTPDSLAYITSPSFGRAKTWKQLKWRGSSTDITPGDSPTVDVIGVDNAGAEVALLSGLTASQQDYDISSINAAQYPYLKLKMRNVDSINYSAYQLRYWRLTYDPVPEGVIAPNLFLKVKDTVDVGEPMDFKVAFKNVSGVPFDSVKVKMIITDRNNLAHENVFKLRPLLGANPDTLQLGSLINTSTIPGLNTIYIEANPDNDQPEQYHFNNFAFRNLYVRPDSLNPILDVTFDRIHILNRDIVSSKPDIIIKLKDEAKWMILNDTSLLTVQVRSLRNGNLRRFYFNNDTLRFTPAGQAPNADNTATINFKPYFKEDGEYELIVTGKDRSENSAGNIEYRVIFEVINKPMISNMLNYPNPFTTSTAFVFTITGSEVPQNLKIEIMTITGKIVREITKHELGPLQIGRNITEFKWDGTDQYGQKLANGIYLYRVVTNLNGKSLDKYKSKDDNTDKYFNKGYGKMYLMR